MGNGGKVQVGHARRNKRKKGTKRCQAFKAQPGWGREKINRKRGRKESQTHDSEAWKGGGGEREQVSTTAREKEKECPDKFRLWGGKN